MYSTYNDIYAFIHNNNINSKFFYVLALRVNHVEVYLFDKNVLLTLA